LKQVQWRAGKGEALALWGAPD